MKRYEYVRVYIGKLIGAKLEEHQSIINDYANRGYRFVCWIPIRMTDYGKVKEIDLVFEMDC